MKLQIKELIECIEDKQITESRRRHYVNDYVLFIYAKSSFVNEIKDTYHASTDSDGELLFDGIKVVDVGEINHPDFRVFAV